MGDTQHLIYYYMGEVHDTTEPRSPKIASAALNADAYVIFLLQVITIIFLKGNLLNHTCKHSPTYNLSTTKRNLVVKVRLCFNSA